MVPVYAHLGQSWISSLVFPSENKPVIIMQFQLHNAVIIVIIINKATEAKHQFFLSVLKRMRANNQAEDIESLDDYTRVWSDQIDRGGLYQIKPEVLMPIDRIM